MLMKVKHKKEIDILFYYRIYSSKNSNFLKSLADKFAETYKVYIVGDYLDNKKLHNLGKIERNQLKSILKKQNSLFSQVKTLVHYLQEIVSKIMFHFFTI